MHLRWSGRPHPAIHPGISLAHPGIVAGVSGIGIAPHIKDGIGDGASGGSGPVPPSRQLRRGQSEIRAPRWQRHDREILLPSRREAAAAGSRCRKCYSPIVPKFRTTGLLTKQSR